MPISKEEFEGSIAGFVESYKRLPFLNEDDIIVKKKNKSGEYEELTYRASRYITAYYETRDNFVNTLVDNDIVTFKVIAKATGLTEAVVKNTITMSTKSPTLEARRAMDIFFDKDKYEHLGKHATLCGGCSRRCKQAYFVEVKCSKFKEKK